MKIMYLTWGETPRSFGVFGSQVIQQFVSTARLMPNDDFYFLSAVPIINSSLVREKMAYSDELKTVRRLLGDIIFERIPIYFPQLFVNSTRFTFRFMHLFAHIKFKKKIDFFDPDVIHCRSYHSAWAALKVRENYGLKYKVVFDGRGLWPEEVALKNQYSKSSKNFRFLKNIESWILNESDVAVALSNSMHSHYQQITNTHVVLVFSSAPVKELSAKRSNSYSKRHSRGTLKVCYVGALSSFTWHRTEQLLDLYCKLMEICENVKLVIVTTSDHQAIRNVFKNVSGANVVLTSTKNAGELGYIFQEADFGVIPYRGIGSYFEMLVGKALLGTKTSEYLSAGLPIIVNSSCVEVATLVNQGGFGVAYDPETFEELSLKRLIELSQQCVKQKAVAFAKEHFDYMSNAKRYQNIYNELMEY